MFFYKNAILGPSGAVFRIIQIPFFDHEIFVGKNIVFFNGGTE